jgi:hypothetical protein
MNEMFAMFSVYFLFNNFFTEIDKYYLGINSSSASVKGLKAVKGLQKEFFYSSMILASKKLKDEYNSSIMNTMDDVEDIIVRHNGKMKDRKKRRGFAEKRQTKNLVIEEAENMKEVITKVKHFECDEMTETEAIYRFEDLGHDSFVFRNANKSSLYCMLYRRGSGDGYGLIVFE